jgi:hypothetical protein
VAVAVVTAVAVMMKPQSSSDSSHTTLVDPVTLPTLAEIVA